MSVSGSSRVRKSYRAPVTGRRRRRGFRVRKSLIAKLLVVAVAFAIGCALVGRVWRATSLAGREQRQRDQIVAEYKSLHKQNDDLHRRLRYLQTPDGIAREARKHGFVKPGEISLVITDDPASKSDH